MDDKTAFVTTNSNDAHQYVHEFEHTLDLEGNWGVALVSGNFQNSNPNVVGGTLSYRDTGATLVWTTVSFPDKIYSFETFKAYFERAMFDNGDTGGTFSAIVPNITLQLDQATRKIIVNLETDWELRVDNLHTLLGASAEDDVIDTSGFLPNSHGFDGTSSVGIACDIVETGTSYSNFDQTDDIARDGNIIYTESIDVGPNEQVNIRPNYVKFFPIRLNKVKSLTIQMYDEDGGIFITPGFKANFTLVFRKFC